MCTSYPNAWQGILCLKRMSHCMVMSPAFSNKYVSVNITGCTYLITLINYIMHLFCVFIEENQQLLFCID